MPHNQTHMYAACSEITSASVFYSVHLSPAFPHAFSWKILARHELQAVVSFGVRTCKDPCCAVKEASLLARSASARAGAQRSGKEKISK